MRGVLATKCEALVLQASGSCDDFFIEFGGSNTELQKRADRADQSVLFFLAGANVWEKHAKNCAIISMAHITVGMIKKLM